MAQRTSQSVAVEIDTGKSDVVWNVKQDLLSRFDTLLIVATDEDALRKLDE